MSANRAGKREREAGNRHKRDTLSYSVSTPSGTEWVTLKLGRKKTVSRLRSHMGPTGGRYPKAAGDGTKESPRLSLPHGLPRECGVCSCTNAPDSLKCDDCGSDLVGISENCQGERHDN
jgi:hypothetical protein